MTSWLISLFLSLFVNAEVQFEEYENVVDTSCNQYQDTINLEPLYISQEEYCNGKYYEILQVNFYFKKTYNFIHKFMNDFIYFSK